MILKHPLYSNCLHSRISRSFTTVYITGNQLASQTLKINKRWAIYAKISSLCIFKFIEILFAEFSGKKSRNLKCKTAVKFLRDSHNDATKKTAPTSEKSEWRNYQRRGKRREKMRANYGKGYSLFCAVILGKTQCNRLVARRSWFLV